MSTAFAAASAGTVIQTIKEMVNYTKSTIPRGSVVKLARPGIVQPECMVSRDLINYEGISDVYSSVHSIHMAYYLLSLSYLYNLKDTKIMNTINNLNPTVTDLDLYSTKPSKFIDKQVTAIVESAFENLTHGTDINIDMLSEESYRWKLPKVVTLSMESSAKAESATGIKTSYKDDIYQPSMNFTSPKHGEGSTAAGQLIHLTFNEKDAKGNPATIEVPLLFKLAVLPITDNVAVQCMTYTKIDQTFYMRYQMWRAGRIGFFNDLVLCRDLGRAHRKALMEDDSKIYLSILNNHKNKRTAGFIKGEAHQNASSNIFIISDTVASKVEYEIGGKFKDFRTRSKIFNDSLASIIVVVSPTWERVTFYYDGMEQSSSMSIKDLRHASKGNGIDISTLMSAIMAGRTPQF